MSKLDNPVVALYRTAYRAPSEAFIKEQALGFKRYTPTIWTRDISAIASSEQSQMPCIELTDNTFLARLVFTLFGKLKKSNLATNQKPDVIHAHFGPDAAVIMPVALDMGVPLVVTCHGFDVQQTRWVQFRSGRLTNILFLIRERQVYARAALVVAVSDYLKKRLIERGCPPEKIIRHYIGVNTSKFKYTPSRNLPLSIVNVARHIDFKAIDDLLRCLAILMKKWPDIRLLQIGEGDETENLKKLAVELGVENNVEWLGAIHHDEIVDVMSKATIYAHPGRKDSAGHVEAFGIALIEAQAVGLPVVAAACGGIPETIRDGETGFLYPENDYKTMAFFIDKLICDEALRINFSESARKNVMQTFNIVEQSKALEEIYDQLINV